MKYNHLQIKQESIVLRTFRKAKKENYESNLFYSASPAYLTKYCISGCFVERVRTCKGLMLGEMHAQHGNENLKQYTVKKMCCFPDCV